MTNMLEGYTIVSCLRFTRGLPLMLAVSATDLAISVVNRLLNVKKMFVLLECKHLQ